MFVKILTAKQHESLRLQEGSRWKLPLTREEAEAVAESKTFSHTHVAVCEGALPIWATVGDRVMLVRMSSGGDDYGEDLIPVKGERDAINKLAKYALESFKSVFENL